MSAPTPDTWMPWYIGAYLRRTMHLNAEEDGAYRRMIDATWLAHGLLRCSDAQKATIAKLTLKRWLAIKDTIAAFFQLSEEGWRHERVSKELAKAHQITDERSKAGAIGAAKRWQKGWQTHGKRIDLPMANAWQTHAPLPSPLPSKKKEPPIAPRKPGGVLVNGDLEKFATWYASYPRHVARGAAEKAFAKALLLVSLEALVSGAQRYAQSVIGKEPQYVAHPATWLNAKRWLDESGEFGVREPRSPRTPPPES